MLGVVECHNFHECSQRMLGGMGQGPPYVFQKCCLWCIAILGSQNKDFQSSILLGREGVTKNSTLLTLLIMLTIQDDPLVSIYRVYNKAIFCT